MNIRCSYTADGGGSRGAYGMAFNGGGGGAYAMEWTEEAIKIWNWAETDIPANIGQGKPDPSTWGLPIALFGGSSCDANTYFKDMSIVLNMVSLVLWFWEDLGEIMAGGVGLGLVW